MRRWSVPVVALATLAVLTMSVLGYILVSNNGLPWQRSAACYGQGQERVPTMTVYQGFPVPSMITVGSTPTPSSTVQKPVDLGNPSNGLCHGSFALGTLGSGQMYVIHVTGLTAVAVRYLVLGAGQSQPSVVVFIRQQNASGNVLFGNVEIGDNAAVPVFADLFYAASTADKTLPGPRIVHAYQADNLSEVVYSNAAGYGVPVYATDTAAVAAALR